MLKSMRVPAGIVVTEYPVVPNIDMPPNTSRLSLFIAPTGDTSAALKGAPANITVPAVVAMDVAPITVPDKETNLPIFVYRPELEKAPTTVKPAP